MRKLRVTPLILPLLVSIFVCVKSVNAQVNEIPTQEAVISDAGNAVLDQVIEPKLEALLNVESLDLVLNLIAAQRTDDAPRRLAVSRTLAILQKQIIKKDNLIDGFAHLLARDDNLPVSTSADPGYVFRLRSYVDETLSLVPDRALPFLFGIMEDTREKPAARNWAASIIWSIKKLSPEQLTELDLILQDPYENNTWVKFWAAATLAANGRRMERIAPPCLTVLNSGNAYQRAVAAETLEKLGDVDKPNFGAISNFFSNLKTSYGAQLPELFDRHSFNYYAYITKYEAAEQNVKNKLNRQENLSFVDERDEDNAENDLWWAAVERATLARSLAAQGDSVDQANLILMGMITEKPFRAGSRIIQFGYADSAELNVLPAFKYLGSAPIERLLDLYQSEFDDLRMQLTVIRALGYVGPPAKDAMPLLFNDLSDTKKPYSVQTAAIWAVGRIGSASPEVVIPKLIAAHNSRRLSQDLAAAEALQTIAQQIADTDTGTKLIPLLEQAQQELNRNDREEVRTNARTIGLAIDKLNNRRWSLLFQNSGFGYGKYLLPFAALLATWLVLLLWRPYYLFQINQKLSTVPLEYKLFGLIGGPLRYVLLVGFFHFSPRVLDAWLKKHISNARLRFSQRTTVKERDHYVPLPVRFDEQTSTSLKPELLRPLFRQHAVALMIAGEGGTGKTSHACLIGKWAMSDDEKVRLCKHFLLPILIEQDSEILLDAKVNFVERAIQTQLKMYAQDTEAPSSELVRKLLKHKRLIVIIDGFSEIPENSRSKIMSDISDLPINALVFTSRHGERLNDYAPVVIQPMRIAGGFLSDFLGTYLVELSVRNRFDDEEFFEACRRISLLSERREVTALLVKLFADLVVATKTGSTSDEMPQNMPELVLYYLNYLNREFDQGDTSNERLHSAAKAVAWECLKSSFHPSAALTKDVLAQLGDNGNPAIQIEHMEHKLGLVRRVGMSRERIRFSLEPLAEYLACLHVIDLFGDDGERWDELLTRLEQATDEEGFIIALQDCCQTNYGESIPGFVRDRIGKITGVEFQDVAKNAGEKRVKQLVRDLKSLNPHYLSAIKDELFT